MNFPTSGSFPVLFELKRSRLENLLSKYFYHSLDLFQQSYRFFAGISCHPTTPRLCSVRRVHSSLRHINGNNESLQTCNDWQYSACTVGTAVHHRVSHRHGRQGLAFATGLLFAALTSLSPLLHSFLQRVSSLAHH